MQTHTHAPLPPLPSHTHARTQTHKWKPQEADLTKTVVAIVGQIESIVTSAAIIAWYIVALMYTAAIMIQITLINVWVWKRDEWQTKYM